MPTKIEWTEESLFHGRKFYAFVKHRNRFQPFFINPIKYIFVFLRTITRYTARHYVSRCCFSFLGYGNNVVPGSSYISTIHTQSFRIFKQNFTSLWGNTLDSTAMFIPVILSFLSVSCIGSIASTGIDVATRAAAGISNLGNWKPQFAFTTPRKTFIPLFAALSQAWLGTAWTSTFTTFSRQSIPPRRITGKERFAFPLLARPAPLKPFANVGLVFVKGQTQTLCRYFEYTNPTAHNTSRFLLYTQLYLKERS